MCGEAALALSSRAFKRVSRSKPASAKAGAAGVRARWQRGGCRGLDKVPLEEHLALRGGASTKVKCIGEGVVRGVGCVQALHSGASGRLEPRGALIWGRGLGAHSGTARSYGAWVWQGDTRVGACHVREGTRGMWTWRLVLSSWSRSRLHW